MAAIILHQSFSPPPLWVTTSQWRPRLRTAKACKVNDETRWAGRVEKRNAQSQSQSPPPRGKAMGLAAAREYARVSVKDYLDRAPEMLKPDGGPPRWFCPLECANPPKDAPLLLFLPGIDGLGLGLIRQHQTLAELFEVRCLHIPSLDRTEFQDLIQFVEQSIKVEHEISPAKPIYLLGDSFGGCLALATASRNPTIDLVLVLCNPATSFPNSQLQPALPFLDIIPKEFHISTPYLLSFIMGDPVRMAMADVKDDLSMLDRLQDLSNSLAALLPRLSVLSDVLPKDTLSWKIKMLHKAAIYANSRLHAVRANVLLLASGRDKMLPSYDEARRISKILPKCKLRLFKDSGHTLLLEDGINVATLIKSTIYYRRSKVYDNALDYIPPTPQEFKVYWQQYELFLKATSPVMFSTTDDGKIIKGLTGIPEVGPVLLVGYHMFMGLELFPLVGELLKQRDILVRGIAHPMLFDNKMELSIDPNTIDTVRFFGAVPVSMKSFFKLLSSGAFAVLYPGGVREAIHRKGEQYKLFWPESYEFVRMAARFGATIIPFGVVGEDDITEILLDYNDLQKIPYTRDWIEQSNKGIQHLRNNMPGEISNQHVHIPLVAPKSPGRFYFLFRKPIVTVGLDTVLKDKKEAHSLYKHVKSEVESALSYLLHKRKEDPYRDILPRAIYEMSWGYHRQAPTFNLEE